MTIQIIEIHQYAKAIQKLRDTNSKPFSFKQNIEARVKDYNTLKNPDGSTRSREERLRLFNVCLHLDSCTGIAYKAESTKFKIIPESQELIKIPADFSDAFLTINYSNINGTELDSSEPNVKYDTPLTKNRILKHPAWQTALENDKALLEEYANIYFKEYKKEKAMAFYVLQNTQEDQLKELVLGSDDYDSKAFGIYSLNYYAYFVSEK